MKGKKLTPKEKDEKIVARVIKDMERLEKKYPQDLLERGIIRYKNCKANSRKLKREITEREEELAQLKKRTK